MILALLSYMVMRGPGDGPLFTFSDGKFLTRDREGHEGSTNKSQHKCLPQLPNRGCDNGSPARTAATEHSLSPVQIVTAFLKGLVLEPLIS